MNGEIIEGKNYEQELLKSQFDFEPNSKVLESLIFDRRSAKNQINLSVNKYKDDKK